MTAFLEVYWRQGFQWMPELLMATLGTLELTGLSLGLAIAVGLCLALARISRFPSIRVLAVTYIEAIRGIPALALLFVIYFGLPDLGIRFDSFTAAIIGLGLNGGAYLAEVFRAGIQAIHRGQREAALSIGMTPAAAMWVIILPQAVRVILPPLANYAIALLKDTSICSIISTPELMLRARDLASSNFLPLHLFVLAGFLYLAMSYPLSRAVARLERHLGRGR